MKYLREQLEEEEQACVDGKKARGCASRTLNMLEARSTEDLPEVLTFNLIWGGTGPKDVLKALTAIPDVFSLKTLFNAREQVDHEYVFRGMICYAHNHYFAIHRRIFLKIAFIEGIDFSQIHRQAQ